MDTVDLQFVEFYIECTLFCLIFFLLNIIISSFSCCINNLFLYIVEYLYTHTHTIVYLHIYLLLNIWVVSDLEVLLLSNKTAKIKTRQRCLHLPLCNI